MGSHPPRRPTAAVSVLATGALALLAGCASSTTADETPTLNPDEEVSISFTYWGNDVRIALYDEAIEVFENEHPNIDVTAMPVAPNDYWEKLKVVASGGGMPDAVAMDLAFIREYSENGLLADLSPYLGSVIDTEPLSDQLLKAGVIEGVTTGIPVSTNVWGMYVNMTLLDQIGAEIFDGETWDDYFEWTADVTKAAKEAGVEAWGATDIATRIQVFELQLRANGSEFFTEGGELGFDEEDLKKFWDSTASLRESSDVVPQQTLEERYPLGGFDAALAVSETNWDNFGSGYAGNLGEAYELALIAPPTSKVGSKDLYQKASQLYSISGESEHPEAAAVLIDFLVNSPESGQIFGSNRGLPASSVALASASLDGISTMIADHEAAVADRLGDPPPVTPSGAGALTDKFRLLAEELGYGTLTVDQAVDEFFAEVDVILNQ